MKVGAQCRVAVDPKHPQSDSEVTTIMAKSITKQTLYNENSLARFMLYKLQNNHFTKQISWLVSCKKGHTSGSNITKKIFWQSYFVIITKL